MVGNSRECDPIIEKLFIDMEKFMMVVVLLVNVPNMGIVDVSTATADVLELDMGLTFGAYIELHAFGRSSIMSVGITTVL
jgi:hypothetical protein